MGGISILQLFLSYIQAENVRRRHNYIPFIMQLFKISAQKGHLPKLVKKAKEIRKRKIEKQKLLDKEKELKELEQVEKLK